MDGGGGDDDGGPITDDCESGVVDTAAEVVDGGNPCMLRGPGSDWVSCNGWAITTTVEVELDDEEAAGAETVRMSGMDGIGGDDADDFSAADADASEPAVGGEWAAAGESHASDKGTVFMTRPPTGPAAVVGEGKGPTGGKYTGRSAR